MGALHRRYHTQAIRERRERSEEADSRERRVALCIRELGLHSERDAMIGVAGDARRRGLSGGQRKRVAVAVELCGDPSALLLDCLLYTSPSPRDKRQSRMPSSA